MQCIYHTLLTDSRVIALPDLDAAYLHVPGRSERSSCPHAVVKQLVPRLGISKLDGGPSSGKGHGTTSRTNLACMTRYSRPPSHLEPLPYIDTALKIRPALFSSDQVQTQPQPRPRSPKSGPCALYSPTRSQITRSSIQHAYS